MSAAPLRRTSRTPRAGTPGHLTTDDGSTVPVSVADGEEGILLVLLDDPTPLFNATGGLTLEASTSRGLVRMHGTIKRLDRSLVRFEVDGSPQILQRRQFVRVIAPQRVELDDSLGHVQATHSLNISGGGMLLTGPQTLELDTEITFRLHLNEKEPPVIGLGRVVRASGDRQRAIVFEDISQADRERLIHFIFDRQRAALAVTRGDTV